MLLIPELRFLRTTKCCPLEFRILVRHLPRWVSIKFLPMSFLLATTESYSGMVMEWNIITLAPSIYFSIQGIPCEPFCDPSLACPHLSAISGGRSTQLLLSLHPIHKGAHRHTEPIKPKMRSLRMFDPNGVAPRVLVRNTFEMNVSVMWKSPFCTPAYVVTFSPKAEKKKGN